MINGQISHRQGTVIQGILDGLTNKEIGGNLKLSENSVKAILQTLYNRTGVRSRSQLVRLTLEGSLKDESGQRWNVEYVESRVALDGIYRQLQVLTAALGQLLASQARLEENQKSASTMRSKSSEGAMKDEDGTKHFYLEDLSEEAQKIVKAECERTGESVEEAVDRICLEIGRRKAINDR